MSTVEITTKNIQATIEKPGVVLLDFWAAWCGPCRAFAPIFEAASKRYPDITFGKVDTEAQAEIAGAFGIQAIPTLMAFRDGVLLFAQPGLVPGAALDQLVTKIRELDMDDVRKQIAAHAHDHDHDHAGCNHDHDHDHDHDHKH